MKKVYWILSLIIVMTNFIVADTIVSANETRTQSITKLYVAVFNRAPDSAGLAYWVKSDFSLDQIAMSFFDQEETQLKYPPELSVRSFVREVYLNLFNREPDLAGLDYWANAIESGEIHRSVFILAVINGALGTDAVILENKMTVGLYFANSGLNDYKASICVIQGVTADYSTVKEAKKKVDRILEGGSCIEEDSYEFSSEVQPTTEGIWYKPAIDTSWEIQLQGDIDSSYDAMLYEVDLFDTDISLIQELKNSGKKVICYFSAGSYEDWRADHDNFPEEVLGNDLDQWPGEKWLNISNEKIAPVMIERLNLAVTKGCDGVDPDNLDGYTNNTGFALSSNDQLAYNKFIANEARKKGLSVGLKNDLNQISELVPFFDFSVNEQCHYYNECNMLSPFIDAGKPVFNIEYDERYVQNTDGARDLMCSNALQLHFKSIVLPHSLDGSFRYSCD